MKRGVEKRLLGQATLRDGAVQLNVKALIEKKGHTVRDAMVKVVLTVGNSSNASYLMAGFNGNHAGSEYWLGQPVWK